MKVSTLGFLWDSPLSIKGDTGPLEPDLFMYTCRSLWSLSANNEAHSYRCRALAVDTVWFALAVHLLWGHLFEVGADDTFVVDRPLFFIVGEKPLKWHCSLVWFIHVNNFRLHRLILCGRYLKCYRCINFFVISRWYARDTTQYKFEGLFIRISKVTTNVYSCCMSIEESSLLVSWCVNIDLMCMCV